MSMRELPPPGPDAPAAALRGRGPVAIAAFVVLLAVGPFVEPLGAVLVLWWATGTRTPWRALGFARPVNASSALAVGIAFGIAFKLAMKSLVMPLLHADPVNQAYHYLAHNNSAMPGMILEIIVGAGVGEEIVYRGFLFERFRTFFGSGHVATAAMVLFGAIVFGAIHYPVQGLPGAEQAFFTGLVLGAIYAKTGRIWMLMVAHAAFDLTALTIIYWDLETKVAHWFYR